MPITSTYSPGTVTARSRCSAKEAGVEPYRGSVNLKTRCDERCFFELIFYGVLERYPKLRHRERRKRDRLDSLHPPAVGLLLSALQGRIRRRSASAELLFRPQIYVTFFHDTAGGQSPTGGARTTACGRTTIRIGIRRGRSREVYRPRCRPLAGGTSVKGWFIRTSKVSMTST